MIPKPKTYRNKKYLDFIRSKPCCLCRRIPSVAHHESITGRGMGIKCSDLETVPFCNSCHSDRHMIGFTHTWLDESEPMMIMLRLINEFFANES